MRNDRCYRLIITLLIHLKCRYNYLFVRFINNLLCSVHIMIFKYYANITVICVSIDADAYSELPV
jgi:hypothetical protein